jgi:hypothetical protein
MIWLRQSTASQEVPLGRFLDSTDGDTEMTALTIANTDIKIWKAGATTFASKNSGGATHSANGLYYAVLDATDTDTIGPGEIHTHVSGALATKTSFVVLSPAVYDSLFGATALSTHTAAAVQALVAAGAVASVTGSVGSVAATVNANVIQFGGVDGTFASGRPEANTSHWGGTAVASANVRANVVQIAGQTASATAGVTFPATISSLTADQVNSEVDAALADYDGPTNAEMEARTLAAANYATASALAAAKAVADAILEDTGTDGVVVAAGSKSGYSLAASGLDAVTIEAGLNARQALSVIAASGAGVVSGAGTGTLVFRGAGVATTRITAAASSGNRTSITLNPPA